MKFKIPAKSFSNEKFLEVKSMLKHTSKSGRMVTEMEESGQMRMKLTNCVL